MSERTAGLRAVALLMLCGATCVAAAEPPKSKPSAEVSEARVAGLQLAGAIIEQLEADKKGSFPDVETWLKDLPADKSLSCPTSPLFA